MHPEEKMARDLEPKLHAALGPSGVRVALEGAGVPADPARTPPGRRRGLLQGQSHAADRTEDGFEILTRQQEHKR